MLEIIAVIINDNAEAMKRAKPIVPRPFISHDSVTKALPIKMKLMIMTIIGIIYCNADFLL